MDSPLKKPAVSVLTLVYNGEKYLRQGIQSILNQSFGDFELVVIDCGSTDKSLSAIKTFRDRRIVLIDNKEKTGITEARNQALRAARGEFIAVLDCDDVAHQDRLRIEINFLKSRPDFGLVGGVVALIDEKGERTGVVWREKIPSEKIPVRLIFGNCFSHSSVMMRREAVPPEGYAEKLAEDYDLWVRMVEKWKAALLPKILLEYRRHDTNNSTETRIPSQIAIENIMMRQLRELGLEPTSEEMEIHRKNYGFAGTAAETKNFIAKREAWLVKLCEANRKTGRWDVKIFNEVAAERFLTTLEANVRLGFYAWQKLWRSSLSKNLNKKEELGKLAKFFIKCLLKRD